MKVDTRANDRKVGGIESPAPEGSEQLPPEKKHKASRKRDPVLLTIERIKILLSEHPEHHQAKILRYCLEDVRLMIPQPAEDKTP